MTTNFFRDLEKIAARIDERQHQAVIRDANSMKYFGEEDETINVGEWMKWRDACRYESKVLPPKDFKKKKVVPDAE